MSLGTNLQTEQSEKRLIDSIIMLQGARENRADLKYTDRLAVDASWSDPYSEKSGASSPLRSLLMASGINHRRIL